MKMPMHWPSFKQVGKVLLMENSQRRFFLQIIAKYNNHSACSCCVSADFVYVFLLTTSRIG